MPEPVSRFAAARPGRRAQLDMLQAMRTKLPGLLAPRRPTAAGEGPA